MNKQLWLLAVVFGVVYLTYVEASIQQVAYLEFPFDTSGRWKAAGNAEGVSGNYELWISNAYLYQIEVNTLTQTMALEHAFKIPPEHQPQVAMLTQVGPSNAWFQFLEVSQQDPFTLKEVRVTPDGTFSVVQSMKIPGLTGYPDWQLFVSQEEGSELDIIYLFALDFVISLDYPDFQFVAYVNVSNHVTDIAPVTKVYGGAAAVLEKQLYMARYSGPSVPGELILFNMIDVSGRFEFYTVTYLGTSPANFEARVGATPAWIFWTQTEGTNGTSYRWTLQEGDFKYAVQQFIQGEAFGPAHAKNEAETMIIYSSGPIGSGYRLSVLSMQDMTWGSSLKVGNDTLPQLALQDKGETDDFAVFGTVTTAQTMKLVLFNYAGYY